MDSYIARGIGADIVKSIDALTSAICGLAIETQAYLAELNSSLTEIKEDIAYIREIS